MADKHASGACVRKDVEVQLLSPAPYVCNGFYTVAFSSRLTYHVYMKFYGRETVEKARRARENGQSLRSIEQLLHVPNSTVSKWVRDIQSPNSFYKNARLLEKKYKESAFHIFDKYSKDGVSVDHAKIFLSLLYWCEGSKYPSTNCVAFSNSDSIMMQAFVTLFRKGFTIDEKKLRVRLQLHSTHNIAKEHNFWSRLLSIPLTQFGKPTITHPNNKRKRVDYRGTCTIKYYDVKLLLQITGIYEYFGSTVCKEGCQRGNGAAC